MDAFVARLNKQAKKTDSHFSTFINNHARSYEAEKALDNALKGNNSAYEIERLLLVAIQDRTMALKNLEEYIAALGEWNKITEEKDTVFQSMFPKTKTGMDNASTKSCMSATSLA